MTKKKTDANDLQATPELEDFRHKYTEEGNGKIGALLLDNYFKAVKRLFEASDLSMQKSATAIEIGCGEGYSTQRLREMMPKTVALEASEYVAHQIPFAKKLNPGLKVTQESIYELKHKDNTFELVYLLEVLEHLDYPEEGLTELLRVTKPGGYLILGVPREPIWRALNMARGTYIKDMGNTPGHLNHWSTRGLVQHVEKHFGEVKQLATPLPWTLVLAQKPEK